MSNNSRSTVAVMVTIGIKKTVDELLDSLKKVGVNAKMRSKVLDVPLMGAVIDLDYEGALRTRVVPPLQRILAATDEDTGRCTVSLFAFHEKERYSETCIIWGNARTHVFSKESVEEKRQETDGRVYITEYEYGQNVPTLLKKIACPDDDPEQKAKALEEAFRTIAETSRDSRKLEYAMVDAVVKAWNVSKNPVKIAGEKDRFCVSAPVDYRGIVPGDTPYVIWGDGEGNMIPLCPRGTFTNRAEIALGDKGVGMRALRAGYEVCTESNEGKWLMSGTKGVVQLPGMDNEDQESDKDKTKNKGA